MGIFFIVTAYILRQNTQGSILNKGNGFRPEGQRHLSEKGAEGKREDGVP